MGTIAISSVLAGIMIAIGGSVYVPLAAEGGVQKIAGAIFFAIGLFSVLLFRFHLFTGKVCYVCQRKDPPLRRLCEMLVILTGNAVGAGGVGLLLSGKLMGQAGALVTAKLQIPLWRVFILSAFCCMLIYLAVEAYRRATEGAVRVTMVFLGVIVFILAGFEHSVADIFYFAAARRLTPEALLFLLVVVLGNAVGGIALASLHALYDTRVAREAEIAAKKEAAQAAAPENTAGRTQA